MLTMKVMKSPLGPLRLFARGDELVGLFMRNHDPAFREAVEGDVAVLRQTAEQLDEYFAGERRAFDLPLNAEGTGFQRLVWRTLYAIPFGVTCRYGDIARAIGRPSASRAVGAANGKNPISIIVPCHRVIGANGALTGYGGGMPAKKWLLAHEGRWSTSMQSPRDPSSFAPRSV
jgi:methylated-DNA-[protein]-cysteine S-methyltransferase